MVTRSHGIIADKGHDLGNGLALEHVCEVRAMERISGIQKEDVIGDGPSHLEKGAELRVASASILTLHDTAMDIVCMDDEEIELAVALGILDDRHNAERIYDSLLLYLSRGDVCRDILKELRNVGCAISLSWERDDEKAWLLYLIEDAGEHITMGLYLMSEERLDVRCRDR